MKRLGLALLAAAVLATAGSLTGLASGRFDQRLAKDKQVVHALNRLTYGPRPGDVDRVRRLGVEKWIRQQLQPHLIAEDPTLGERLQALATLNLATWQTLEKYQPVVPGLVVNAVPPRRPLAQLVTPEQLATLSSGTPDERAAVLGAIGPDNLGNVMSSLTPQMLDGLPELQKLAASTRRLAMERERRALTFNTTNMSLNNLLSADQRRVAQTGTVEQRRELLMALDPEKRRQVLRVLPPNAVAGIPELQREALAARQPPQFVNQELMEGRIYRAVYSNRQLEEVLVDFWMNHFNVFNGKGQARLLLTSYERDAIRPHVLGRFRDLLLATARHPAMLLYLDNWLSQVPRDDVPAPPLPANVQRLGLNENYGRELMELHTLGVDGGYTQDDVLAVARAFTGWTIYDVNKFAEFQFNPAMHDRKEKVVLGHTLPAGGGERDGIQVIDILARHPSTAKFISKKLAQRFVADVPPQTLVDRMAATFAETSGDLRAVMETMVTSREFMSEGAWQAKLKSPLELVLSSVRALDADVTDAAILAQRITELGQPLYGKVEPTGYPNTGEAWANSAGFLGRINFAGALAAGRIEGVKINPKNLSTKPEETVDRLLGGAASPGTLAVLAEGVTGKGVTGEEPPPETLREAQTASRLAAVVLASPDFQRR